MENNYYYETLSKQHGVMSEDDLTRRLEDCVSIANELEVSNSWKVLLKDCDSWVRILDDKWQDAINKPETLKDMAVLKNAYNHIRNMVDNYNIEIESIKKELSDRQSSQPKDYYRE